MPTITECKHCTVPVANGDECQFCIEYHPPTALDARVPRRAYNDQVDGERRETAAGPEKDWDDVKHSNDYSTYVAFGKELNARHCPLPEGAKTDSYWSRMDANGVRTRELYWDDFGVEGSDEACVGIVGEQYSDGRILSCIDIHLADEAGPQNISVDVARGLLVALQSAIARYDEIEASLNQGQSIEDRVAGLERDCH